MSRTIEFRFYLNLKFFLKIQATFSIARIIKSTFALFLIERCLVQSILVEASLDLAVTLHPDF